MTFWKLKFCWILVPSKLDRQRWSEGWLRSSGLYQRMLALPAQVQGYHKLTAKCWRDSQSHSIPFWVAGSYPACHCGDEEVSSDGHWVIYLGSVYLYIPIWHIHHQQSYFMVMGKTLCVIISTRQSFPPFREKMKSSEVQSMAGPPSLLSMAKIYVVHVRLFLSENASWKMHLDCNLFSTAKYSSMWWWQFHAI